ncbi:MAG: BRO-N domain-containing protein [Plesiomonas sp.]|uniref:BRO-N domain-containing protein n=1 Tax=Plesiomonas sp. TaxID=2486279 RepID=UPI003F35BCE1
MANVSNMTFADQTLRVLTGHPEHDILFVAGDVVKMAGLDKNATLNTVNRHGDVSNSMKLNSLLECGLQVEALSSLKYHGNWKAQWLFSESLTYQMLLRGHAKQSEPFRKWVTEEVLPSIRKIGTYDIKESNTAEAKMFTEEFAALRGQIEALTPEMLPDCYRNSYILN